MRGKGAPAHDGGAALPLSSATAPERPVGLAITSPAEQMTFDGLCSDYPVFVDDQTLVYSRREDQGMDLRRRDLGSGQDVALTHDGGNCFRPVVGPPGMVDYLFQRRAEASGSEVREVPVAGGESSLVVRGGDPAFSPSANALFYLGGDGHSIRKRVVGGADTVLYDAPSSRIFDSMAVSPDGGWLVTSLATAVPWPAHDICVVPLANPAATVDCKTAGWTNSVRAAFGASDSALYFARDGALVRFDLDRHSTQSAAVTPGARNFAIAPGGASAVYSTCRAVYTAYRVGSGGALEALPASAAEAGLLNVGPHGELAFSVEQGGQFVLGVTDSGGKDVRVLTTPEHTVIEIAFSPDGKRLAFHDATSGSGGIFVVDVHARTQPTQLTTNEDDQLLLGWLDDEHVLYMHPEKGLPYGRTYVIAAAGGEPRALPRLPGVLLGAVPSRGEILLALRSPGGDRIALATKDGALHPIALQGVPPGMQWEVSTAASPSGRYVTWFSKGAAWEADLEEHAPPPSSTSRGWSATPMPSSPTTRGAWWSRSAAPKGSCIAFAVTFRSLRRASPSKDRQRARLACRAHECANHSDACCRARRNLAV